MADLRCMDGRRKSHVSKLVPIPHLPAVIAARGEVRYTCVLAGAMLMAGTFDDMIDTLPALADQMPKVLPKPAADHAMEVVLAGWSPRRRRLMAYVAVKPEGGAAPSTSPIPLPAPRAHGGPVTAGRAYIVGEDQPELFIPRQSGTIIPSVPNLDLPDVGMRRVERHVGGDQYVSVKMDVHGVRDVDGFRRSQPQLEADLQRRLANVARRGTA